MKGMDFKTLQDNWDKFGHTDPLWSILSMPNRKGNKWDIKEFFATGEKEVADLLAYLKAVQLSLPTGQALDFGCGIGRVTQPLCEHFEVCHGVDIAPSMIKMARELNQYGDRCQYHLNERQDLQQFADNTIDFIYCVITFQNMAPRYAKQYLQEFLRILAPHGLLIFQIPSEPRHWRLKIKQQLPQPLLNLFYRIKYNNEPVMEMHGVPKEEIFSLLNQHQGRLLHIKEDHRAFEHWFSYQYFVTKGAI